MAGQKILVQNLGSFLGVEQANGDLINSTAIPRPPITAPLGPSPCPVVAGLRV
jgi:hypothetical protein